MSFLVREITKDDKQELESMAKEFQNANDEYLFEGINNFFTFSFVTFLRMRSILLNSLQSKVFSSIAQW